VLNISGTGQHDDDSNSEVEPEGESTEEFEDLSLPPDDLKTPEDVLKWFASNPYAIELDQAMQNVLGEHANYSQVSEAIAGVLNEWINSPDDYDFLYACDAVVRLSETQQDIAKNCAVSLLNKQYFSSQAGVSKLRRTPQGETDFQRTVRLQAITRAETAKIKIAEAKIQLIRMFDPNLSFWFHDMQRRVEARNAIRTGLRDVLPNRHEINSDDRRSTWRACLLYGTDNQRALAKVELGNVIGRDRRQAHLADDEIFELAVDSSELVSSIAKELIFDRLRDDFGIDQGTSLTLMKSWKVSADEVGQAGAIRRNIDRIEYMESQRPGMTLALKDRYGIQAFGRYPAEALIWQFDHGQKPNLDYGLLVFPREDHNGAFYSDEITLEDLFNNMLSDEQRWGGFVIIEADNRLEMIRRVNAVRKTCGSASFGIIAGHGTERSIQFGDQFDSGGKLLIEDISMMTAVAGRFPENKITRETPPLFKEGSTIILDSCSTGSAGGIGAKISELTRGKVIAPLVPTGIRKIDFIPPLGETPVPSFSVDYKEEGQGVTLKDGESVASSNPQE